MTGVETPTSAWCCGLLYLYLYVMRLRSRSYGDSSILTLSLRQYADVVPPHLAGDVA